MSKCTTHQCLPYISVTPHTNVYKSYAPIMHQSVVWCNTDAWINIGVFVYLNMDVWMDVWVSTTSMK